MSSLSPNEQRRAAAREHMESLFKHAAELSASMPQTNILPVAKLAESQLSEARLAANRANAQSSTGPKTDEGKSVSRENSFKHGIYSKQLVIKGEDPAALDALKSDLLAEHQPATLTEQILVNEMADHYWRLLRFRRFEAGLMQAENVSIPQLTAVQRFMNTAERGFHKALETLRELQKERSIQNKGAAASEVARVNGAGAASGACTVRAGFVPAKPEQHASSAPQTNSNSGFVPPKEAPQTFRRDETGVTNGSITQAA